MKTIYQYLDDYETHLDKQKKAVSKIRAGRTEETDEERVKGLLVNEARMARLLRPLLSFLPLKSPYVDFGGGDMVFTMEEESGVFHVVMNELLPHRFDHVFLDATTLEELRTRIALDYATSLISFQKNHSIPARDSVFVCFVNFYKAGTKPCDADNLDPKIFIDNVIVPTFVPDDSGDKISYAMFSSRGETDHTEVYIGGFEEVLPHMKKYSGVHPYEE